jgi:hypothetical protein
MSLILTERRIRHEKIKSQVQPLREHRSMMSQTTSNTSGDEVIADIRLGARI